jgi:SAM-dependent methyltransferase
MHDPVEFRSDLYRGTASFYDRYRLSYPTELIRDLVSRTSLDGTGRLLDVACGTGQVAFALRRYVADVVAIDQERDMVDYAREKAIRLGLRNMQWVSGRAEDFTGADPFDLVTIGNAFHRLGRSAVAERARQWLTRGGHLALVWSDGPSTTAPTAPTYAQSAPWQRVLTDCAQEWSERVGETGRVPAGWEAKLADRPHTAVLGAAGFGIVGRYEFADVHDWALDELVGFLYSTSFFPRAALGDGVAEFEADLAQRLLAVEPSGVFRQEISAAYELATAPALR